ncbi:MAG: HAMP domain-containing histidine kinase [Clostridia bacterium]|nr:HAMP domain-containing histidine kinase [Clostridia bacterium]
MIKIKSVSTRYMLIFMAIIVITVLILGIIITSIVSSFSLDTKLKETYNANQVFYMYYDNIENKTDSLEENIKKNEAMLEETLEMIRLVSSSCEIALFDKSGELIYYADVNVEDKTDGFDLTKLPLHFNKTTLSKAIVESEDFLQDGFLSRSDGCNLLFSREVVYYLTCVKNEKGESIGYSMLFDPGATEGDLIFDMIFAIVTTVIWISIVALIAIYGISIRVMRPLREIGKAARSFSKGDFSVRVTVRGEDELAELASSINKMAEDLQAKDESQKTFLSNVSHDLKTPMTTIAGFVDGILDGAIPTSKQDYYLNIIKSEVQRLSRLVSSLLDVSRLQSGERKFDMKPFNLCELTRETIISLEGQILEKNLDVDIDYDSFDMICEGDRDAINQVVYNLCHNAIKFSYEGGKYIIKIQYVEDKVQFSIYNEGIGISNEDKARIFDRFYKGDKSRGLDKTGVGLGLFITKTIIDSHNEKIFVDSEYGKYCKFTFTLPRKDI